MNTTNLYDRARELFDGNQRLADYLAAKVYDELLPSGVAGVSLDGLQHAAMNGLAEAAIRYAGSGGTRSFGSYAHPIILAEVMEQLTARQQSALPWFLRRYCVVAIA